MTRKTEYLEKKIAYLEEQISNLLNQSNNIQKNSLHNNESLLQLNQKVNGLHTALCIDTIDIWKQNRIRFYSPLFNNPKQPVESNQWAIPVSALGGFDDSGLNWVPPAGSTVCLLFMNGDRNCPYYIGTTWHRDRGPDGQHNWGTDIPEYQEVSDGKRNGYLVGPNDGSQAFPPWNTENYNGYDIDSVVDFESNPDARKLITYPNIYGFSTPEKHRIKMVDGDPKCNRKWKRFEITSSCGNWIMLKDDHLHYAGQWANPKCGGKIKDGDVSCVQGASISNISAGIISNPNLADQTPLLGISSESLFCNGTQSNSKIIGGHPSTGAPETKYLNSQIGANPFFKHKQECRPYKGASTPQNNSVDLPQSGIQIMSISGHTFVMDDSVEEPSGDPTWDREFDFGCNNHYVGRTYWKSATGHMIEMSDVESPQGEDGANLRGEYNYIKLLSANGNKIELNDHTTSKANCPGCPPNVAGEKRGIHLQSTSNHTIDMCDDTNEQCSPCRMEGGEPVSKAKKAYVRIRTGYGLEMDFNDDHDQKNTDAQFIRIFAPQKDNQERGPHVHLYQEVPSGPGLVSLRVGGNYLVTTYDNHYTQVGTEDNRSDLYENVTGQNLVNTYKDYINKTEQRHLFIAKEQIFLLAGEDCTDDPNDCGGCGGTIPCLGSVLVYDYCSGCIRLSDRVFASTSKNATPLSIQMVLNSSKCPGC